MAGSMPVTLSQVFSISIESHRLKVKILPNYVLINVLINCVNKLVFRATEINICLTITGGQTPKSDELSF